MGQVITSDKPLGWWMGSWRLVCHFNCCHWYLEV